jgi:hypothetical protein
VDLLATRLLSVIALLEALTTVESQLMMVFVEIVTLVVLPVEEGAEDVISTDIAEVWEANLRSKLATVGVQLKAELSLLMNKPVKPLQLLSPRRH